MDWRDQVLLDKQTRRLIAPRHDGVIALVIAAMFFAGLSSGVALAHHKDAAEQAAQIASNNAVIALAIPDNATPIVRR